MAPFGMHRREFLGAMSLGLAGAAVSALPGAAWAQMPRGGRMGMGMGGGMGRMVGAGTPIADPPVGALLSEPILATNVGTSPGLVEVNLEARMATLDVGGLPARLLTYNGQFPGPTIRVRRGDILKVNFTNRLPEIAGRNPLGFRRHVTNLHTHGWHVSPEEPADFVMYSLRHGESYHHEYDTSTQPGGTLCFYHTHQHGVSAEQYWAGMVGALIVEDEISSLQEFETHLLILKDLSIVNGEPVAHAHMHAFMHGMEGDMVMVNGQVNPRLSLKAGQIQRWRILNASNARFYKLALESHQLYLIGTDGGLLDQPYPVSELLLSPGERVDVLVRADRKSGTHRLRALPYARMGMGGMGMGRGMACSGMMGAGTGSLQALTLMTVSYADAAPAAQRLPASINPAARRLDPAALPIAAERHLVLGMKHGRGYINGQDFDVRPYTITSKRGTYERWTISNPSGMDHPFHQHVNAAQVLSVTGGDPGYASLYARIPALKDTVLVPMGGSVTMLVPVKDFEGMAMFHCHILEHEDIGMMGVWNIGMGM